MDIYGYIYMYIYVYIYVYRCTYYIHIYDGSTNRSNLDFEPKYLTKSDVQLYLEICSYMFSYM